jgi:hypothetical protein
MPKNKWIYIALSLAVTTILIWLLLSQIETQDLV